MTDLFAGQEPAQPAKVSERFDWIELFCKEKFGVPADWRWHGWERKEVDKPHEYLLVHGAVCHAKFEKGKRKGQTNWKLKDASTEATHVIRRKELEAFQVEWSKRTGLCNECYGTGQAWAGWSLAEGTRYKPCRHCDATGIFKAAPPPHSPAGIDGAPEKTADV